MINDAEGESPQIIKLNREPAPTIESIREAWLEIGEEIESKQLDPLREVQEYLISALERISCTAYLLQYVSIDELISRNAQLSTLGGELEQAWKVCQQASLYILNRCQNGNK